MAMMFIRWIMGEIYTFLGFFPFFEAGQTEPYTMMVAPFFCGPGLPFFGGGWDPDPEG